MGLVLGVAFAGCGGRSAPLPVANYGVPGRRCETIEQVFALPEPDIDFGTAALLLCREIEPDLDVPTLVGVLDRRARRCLPGLRQAGTLAQRIGWIGAATHGDTLRYEVDRFLLSDAVSAGVGNCLSGSMLYLAILQRLGLRAAMVRPPGHALVRLFDPDGATDIETTVFGYRAAGESPDVLSYHEEDLAPVSARQALGCYTVRVADGLVDVRPERARQLVVLVRASCPDDARLLRQIAGVLDALDRTEEALAALDRSLALRPDDPITLAQLAVHHANAERWEAVAAPARRSLAIEPRDPVLWLVWGRACVELGEPAEALAAVDRALGIDLDALHPVLRQSYELSYEMDPRRWLADAYLVRGDAYDQLEDADLDTGLLASIWRVAGVLQMGRGDVFDPDLMAGIERLAAHQTGPGHERVDAAMLELRRLRAAAEQDK